MSEPMAAPTNGTAPAAYASWFQRVGAYIIDDLAAALAGLPLFIGNAMLSDGDGGPIAWLLTMVGVVTFLVFWIWNVCLRQGQTGYSIGKGVLGIKLIKEETGRPIGPGLSFGRYLCHILDSIFYIGYLWPLWDAKRQTFADKIVRTVVIIQPQA